MRPALWRLVGTVLIVLGTFAGGIGVYAAARALWPWLVLYWPWLLAGVAAVVALGAWWLWWRLPKRQMRSITAADPKARADIEDNFRKTIGQLLGGAAVLISAAFAYVQFTTHRQEFEEQQETAQKQLRTTVQQIEEQQRAAHETLQQQQQAASATLLLQLRDKLDGDRYAAITAAIQGHGHTSPLLRGDGKKNGKFSDLDVERYLSNFEDIGYLSQESLILPDMAYHHFSYDVEKAWCNDDVQRVIREARKSDKSVTAASDPFYGRLETLAQSYLAREQWPTWAGLYRRAPVSTKSTLRLPHCEHLSRLTQSSTARSAP